MGRNLGRWQFGLGKKGSMRWKEQRRQGWMVVVDGQAAPIGAAPDSASASEIKRLQPTLEKIAVPRQGGGRPRQNPVRIITDKGYDSDPLGQRRLKGGIEL
ncbi:hypothetical protein CMK12_03815 [Candidatus Poribacteria bacterium]|nr:hypothetical protein [Candidatus Poribacteria bacterium]MDP6751282.1 hypothetical protein [Candidatus Poribacteria bacterium]